jgi:hypothetical protein
MVVELLCGGDELRLKDTYSLSITDLSGMLCRAMARVKSKQKYQKENK